MDVAGSFALVTGGASGLGLATVRELIDSGGKVGIIDLPSSAGEDVAGELGEECSFFASDVLNEEQVSRVLDEVERLGRLRIVVNCAGIGYARRVVSRSGVFPLEEFRKVLDVNLVGTFNVIRLAAERMASVDPVGEERGVIVNTASVAAFEGQIGQAAYSASKNGVVGMTLPIARELADVGIRVVSIAPGIFETPILSGLSEEALASLGSQVPHPKRLGMPAEYAELVKHIVNNPMLNGETIRLDGAVRMAPR